MRFLYERETNELSPLFFLLLPVLFFFSLLLQSCMYETGKLGKTKVLTGVRREASISSCEQQRCPLLLLFLLLVSPAFELMMSQNDLSCFLFLSVSRTKPQIVCFKNDAFFFFENARVWAMRKSRGRKEKIWDAPLLLPSYASRGCNVQCSSVSFPFLFFFFFTFAASAFMNTHSTLHR